jgi:HEPN domain-containing protein
MGKTEILKQWLDKGKDELRSAEYLSTIHYPTPDEVICYLCQQSVEKYLKAFLFSPDIEPDKTHDLEYLLEICKKYNKNFSSLQTKVYILTRYAVLP